MASPEKRYRITVTRVSLSGPRQVRDAEGTLAELVEDFGYTLKVGANWEHEEGNRKIDQNPKTIESLVRALNDADDNRNSTGMGMRHYRAEEITAVTG